MLSGEENMELKMKGRPPNIQDDVERTKGAIEQPMLLEEENIELKMKGPPPNIQDDVHGTKEIINSVKRPAGCYIIR